jgi:hypothetical protein
MHMPLGHTTTGQMGVRQRPSHRIRRASGPTRPALGPLADFWATYDPREPKEVLLRYRSAPWDDILSGDEDDATQTEEVTEHEPTSSEDEEEEQIQDSPTVNLIGRPPPPDHYISVAVPAIRVETDLLDPAVKGILSQGVHLPPPVFMKTQPSTLMDQVMQDLEATGILQPCPEMRYAFRIFLIAKSSGAARPVEDLSPWTPHYVPPPNRLYSAAEVLTTISPRSFLIKVDLRSGFFQIPIRPEYYRYYGVYYHRRRLAWTRLLMGHPLAPSIMQRVATAVARSVTQQFNITMVAYLDDWLFFFTTSSSSTSPDTAHTTPRLHHQL